MPFFVKADAPLQRVATKRQAWPWSACGALSVHPDAARGFARVTPAATRGPPPRAANFRHTFGAEAVCHTFVRRCATRCRRRRRRRTTHRLDWWPPWILAASRLGPRV